MHEKPIAIELDDREGCAAIVFGGRLQQLLGPAKALRFVAFFARKIEATRRQYNPWMRPCDGPVSAFYVEPDSDFRNDSGVSDYDLFCDCLVELRSIWFDMRDGDNLPVFDVAMSGRDLSVSPGFCRSPIDFHMPMLIGDGKGDFWRFLGEILEYEASLIEEVGAVSNNP